VADEGVEVEELLAAEDAPQGEVLKVLRGRHHATVLGAVTENLLVVGSWIRQDTHRAACGSSSCPVHARDSVGALGSLRCGRRTRISCFIFTLFLPIKIFWCWCWRTVAFCLLIAIGAGPPID